MGLKEVVKGFWERHPCGAADVAGVPEGSLEFFQGVEQMRYEGDDFMRDVAGFDRWKDRDVVEVGCGLGTDLLRFARGGARVCGVDLTERAARLTRTRLGLYGVPGRVLVADGEKLPLRDRSFDLVYSWGVVHHTPDPPAMVRELVRVCRPGGRVLAMVYHRNSLLALQTWLFYGLLRGRPWRIPHRLIAEHLESPGTRVYTRAEAARLFAGLEDLEIRTIVTRYDLRIGRRRFLPRWIRRWTPARWGWFMVIEGVAR